MSWIATIRTYGRSGVSYGPFLSQEEAEKWVKYKAQRTTRFSGYSIYPLFEPDPLDMPPASKQG